jgi:hypothetical protein
MTFDKEYYDKLVAMINGGEWFKDEQWYTVDNYTETPDKFLSHLKFYIDNRIAPTELDVVLSHDYETAGKFTKFKVIEFFQGIINDYSNLPPTVKPAATMQVVPIPQSRSKSAFDKLKPKVKQ